METSKLDSLPIELFESIIVQLCLNDLKQLRLTSLALAGATRPYLARSTFSGYLWRDDIRRLYELSKLTVCAERIRSVCLNFARMDEYRAFHDSFSFFYLIDPELRSERLNLEWSSYYAARRHAASLGESRAEPRDIRPAMAALTNLTSLRLTWRDNPWEGPEMERVFKPDESMEMVSPREVDIQWHVLRWLWSSDAPLENLEIDALSISGRKLLQLEGRPPGEAVRTLKTFKVRIGSGGDSPKAAAQDAVARLAIKMSQLETFELDGEVVSTLGAVPTITNRGETEVDAIEAVEAVEAIEEP
jgi:hypothetical protein